MTYKRRLKVTDQTVRRLLGTYDRDKGIQWDPHGFALESGRLTQKVVEASVQVASLAAFEANPRAPMTYVVSGNPDDVDARYFAGYLAQLHRARLGLDASVAWAPVIGNFENPLMREQPTMLVLHNLTPRSSNLKFEKVRDLVEVHRKIPKVLVVAGEDPLSFAATKLHTPCHGIAYFGRSISNTFNEVI